MRSGQKLVVYLLFVRRKTMAEVENFEFTCLVASLTCFIKDIWKLSNLNGSTWILCLCKTLLKGVLK